MTGRYVVSQHAVERLDERSILEWQVVDGVEHSVVVAEHPNDTPNPSVEARQLLADGTEVKAVWSHIVSDDIAKLVTVHYLDK
jgi:hypothetical protein